jgi:hypothetical protein
MEGVSQPEQVPVHDRPGFTCWLLALRDRADHLEGRVERCERRAAQAYADWVASPQRFAQWCQDWAHAGAAVKHHREHTAGEFLCFPVDAQGNYYFRCDACGEHGHLHHLAAIDFLLRRGSIVTNALLDRDLFRQVNAGYSYHLPENWYTSFARARAALNDAIYKYDLVENHIERVLQVPPAESTPNHLILQLVHRWKEAESGGVRQEERSASDQGASTSYSALSQ